MNIAPRRFLHNLRRYRRKCEIWTTVVDSQGRGRGSGHFLKQLNCRQSDQKYRNVDICQAGFTGGSVSNRLSLAEIAEIAN